MVQTPTDGMLRLGVRAGLSFGGEGELVNHERQKTESRETKAFTIVDRDACCEAQSDSRLGTNTDFLDGLSFDEMSYLGWVFVPSC